MMPTATLFSLFNFPSVLGASVDYTGIGSIIAAITALVALYYGYKTNKRTASNTEEVSYVENNLKTMQTTLDWVTKDNVRLRELNEEQRLEIDEINKSLNHIEIELDKCKRSHELMRKHFNELGEQNGKQ